MVLAPRRTRPPQKQTYPITQIATHTRRAAEGGAAGRLPTALSAEHAELATRELCLLDERRLWGSRVAQAWAGSVWAMVHRLARLAGAGRRPELGPAQAGRLRGRFGRSLWPAHFHTERPPSSAGARRSPRRSRR